MLFKRKLAIIIVLLLLVVLGEIVLRFYGFTHAPLHFASDQFEYLCSPNQEGYRFGNYFHYNSYSQRSEEPDTTKKIILGLGDSVINGGVLTDQDSLATTLFSKSTNMQMLNISAGSWGPDNCVAYLNQYGLFRAKALFLLVSSHDAYDNMEFDPVVGIHKSFPEKNYFLAYCELIDRYLIPRLFPNKKLDPNQQVVAGIHKNGKTFNTGFDGLKEISLQNGIPFIVYLHAELSETKAGKYNEQGQQIIDWAEKNRVCLIKELDDPLNSDEYRDNIHINMKGQRKLADCMKKIFSDL